MSNPTPTPIRHGDWRVIDGKLVDASDPKNAHLFPSEQSAKPTDHTESALTKFARKNSKKG